MLVENHAVRIVCPIAAAIERWPHRGSDRAICPGKLRHPR